MISAAGSGDVTISGWAERSVSVETENAIAVSRESDTLTISAAHTPLRLQLPYDAAIEIERRDGDVRTEAFIGALTVRDAGDISASGRPERRSEDWGCRSSRCRRIFSSTRAARPRCATWAVAARWRR